MELVNESRVIEMQHMHEDGNRCAVHLGNLAHDLYSTLVLLSATPHSLLSLLIEDAHGKKIMR